MSVINYKIVAFIISIVFLLTSASGTVVINSEDWKDVYNGMYYASEEEKNDFFVRSDDAQGLLDLMRTNNPITIIQSQNDAYVGNLDTVLETRGYDVEETITVDQAGIDLYDEDYDDIVLIGSGDSSASLPAASLAQSIDAWPIILDENNLEDVLEILEDADGEVIMVGSFTRDVSEEIRPHSTEEIVNPNKFELSVEVAERVLQESDPQRVLITDGRRLESEIMSDESPILLSGTNFPPESMKQFLIDNDQIQSATIISSELYSVGETMKNDLEEQNRDLSVIVKYGTAPGDSTQIYALDMFPIPVGDFELNIESAEYDINSEELFVTYTNIGSNNMYQLTTLTVENQQGVELDSAGDDEPVFIGGDRSITRSYEVDVDSTQLEDAQVRFTTSYGETPNNLDTYVSTEEEGVFGPPYILPLSVGEIEDNSEVELTNFVYHPDVERFQLDIENTGETTAYTTASLQNVIVRGVEESFTSREEINIESGDTETVYVPAELDRIDIEDNDEILVTVNYGENEGVLVNSKENSMEFAVAGGLVGAFTSAATSPIVLLIILMLLLGGAAYYYRENYMEEESSQTKYYNP